MERLGSPPICRSGSAGTDALPVRAHRRATDRTAGAAGAPATARAGAGDPAVELAGRLRPDQGRLHAATGARGPFRHARRAALGRRGRAGVRVESVCGRLRPAGVGALPGLGAAPPRESPRAVAADAVPTPRGPARFPVDRWSVLARDRGFANA